MELKRETAIAVILIGLLVFTFLMMKGAEAAGEEVYGKGNLPYRGYDHGTRRPT